MDPANPTGAAEPSPISPESTSPPRAASAVVEVEEYLLDDIPLFHLPMAGPTILSLSFRTGRADEPVPLGGMTHLAEHLVLTSVDDALDHSNGSTEPLRVTFIARGSPAKASKFLRDVCRAIERPPIARMHEEANVLRTEAAGRGPVGMSLRLVWAQTGFQGIGTSLLPEYFLRKMDEAALRTWIAERFTAGNAAIWIAGDIPDDLLVALPPGDRSPLPDVRFVPELRTPTMVVDDLPAIGASFFMKRTPESSAAIQILDRHLRRALRVDRGLGYDVGSDYFPVDPDRAFATIWASCLPSSVPEVQKVVLEAIDDMAARGPTDVEIGELHERGLQDVLDPMSFPARLDRHVSDALLGRSPRPMGESLDHVWRMQPDEVALAFREARESMVFHLARSGVLPQRHFEPYPGHTLLPMGAGKWFLHSGAKRRVPWGKARAPKLIVAENGVSIDDERGQRITALRWDECVAVAHDHRSRTLIGLDGLILEVNADDWRDGNGAVKLVDRFAPGDLRVPPAG